MKRKVLFYCQHVLGMGHLVRSAEIVRGLIDEGMSVSFLNGGELAPGTALPVGMRVVMLPALASDADFKDLRAADSSLAVEEILQRRKEMILAEYRRFQPDVLVIELFPFGRRKFAFELMPLLEEVRAHGGRTKIVCSLRDILVSKRDQTRFEDKVIAAMNEYFDLLLVHSDPRLQTLDETFPRIGEIRTPIRYTGFVAEQVDETASAEPVAAGLARILVSIGGGRVGAELLESSIAASRVLDGLLPHRMQLFAGPYMAEEEYRRLRELAARAPSVRFNRHTTRFLSHLKVADLSVSMAGYNTCMNILTTGTRSLVVPFTGGNNQEQTIRAQKLEQLGALRMLAPGELQPDLLARRILHSLEQDRGRPSPLDLNGRKTAAREIALCAGGNG